MSTNSIGIVGCAGDLGSAIAAQGQKQGFEILGFDPVVSNPVNVIHADQTLGHVGELAIPRVPSLSSLFEESEIVHWCAPIEGTAEIPVETDDGLLVLHDSVMANSAVAKRSLEDRIYRSISIVHFLMNDHQKVVVAEEGDSTEQIIQHVSDLGLLPEVMSIDEHDTVMAHSQAPFAVLHELLADELARYQERGLLTPSGEALSGALTDRSAIWTDLTMKTLLSNPQLPSLIENMAAMLRVKNGHS